MSDKMTPIPFPALMDWILTERAEHGSVFGVRRHFQAVKGKQLSIFGEKLDTPFGPAAGPHTQLAQNIIAAYYAGARFFELKTVQIMDGEELSKCVPKPCITAGDECYNCEWSTELTVEDAFWEYVKAWFAIKLLSKEWDIGDPDGFIFNMSVGYDYAGITSPKIDNFIESLKDASNSPAWKTCMEWAKANASRFSHVDDAYLDGINPHICRSITLSTLHGCPPTEIERIASYLIETKKLHTFVKCNPTILGYKTARKILDDLGFDYIVFDEHHFNEDLQYKDAVPMFRRLLAKAAENGVTFGLKLSNTFPVDVTRNELPSSEMYMSGRSLYPLTIEMAKRISAEFAGTLRLSFSGGIDVNNIAQLFKSGIWPITLATTLLKPGGYQRLEQMANKLLKAEYQEFDGVSVGKVEYLATRSKSDSRNKKAIKPLPNRKIPTKVPLTTCFTAPCTHGCPIHQDIPEYVELVGKGKYKEALELILQKNPLPFMTGTICSHHCMDKCTRTFYEESVHIRDAKLVAAKNGFEEVIKELKPAVPQNREIKAAVIGGGPAGMAAAYFLGREGAAVTLFERREKLGGIVRYVIPPFRITDESIDKDAEIIRAMGVDIRTGKDAPSLKELKKQGYTAVIYATGAWKRGDLRLENGTAINVLDFLEQFKNNSLPSLGEDIAVIGGGNTAMDAARTALRVPGVKHVRLVYRRTRRYMPADEEELALALEDGVEFSELLAPKSLENGMLICDEMRLGDPDASGRRSPVKTGKTVQLPCSALISATGNLVDDGYFREQDIDLTQKGRVAVDDLLQTSKDSVFVIGDANRGPATIVEAIADARTVTDAIIGQYAYRIPSDAEPAPEDCLKKQGILRPFDSGYRESERCLACSSVCECCVQVCPNRANIALDVKGMRMPQIIHVDRMCNECGNCYIFCPYDSRPYKEKLTLFSTEDEFDGSENPGFFHISDKKFKLRMDGKVCEIDLEQVSDLDTDIEKILFAVLADYSYLLT